MIIREFLCIHESGTVLFHRKYQTGNSTDIILRSGLISALYNYATAVEDDAIDILQMSKVSLFFKKREQPLLFVIFIESTINPQWCEKEIDHLLERFFTRFPEVMWQREVVDISIFESFTADADEILLPLGKKIALLLFLIEDGLLTEKEYLQEGLDTLGRKIGNRLLEKHHESFKQALSKGQNYVLTRIDQLVMQLDGEHVKREDLRYFLQCKDCYFCKVDKNGCFFEEFLSILLSSLGIIEVEIITNT
ncbi:MAG: hypothetical protein ACW98F_17890 [Candidatus Hodarchaeales archaeon]|jgi:hypothetical protein